MNVRHLLISMAPLLAVLGSPARGEDVDQRHIQIAEIEVDPAQLDSYKAAVQEQIDATIRLEPGVLVSRCSRYTATGRPTLLICRRLIS
jgi:hypothetical protein